MVKFKSVTVVVLTLLILSCSGTKKDEIDYSQITDAELMMLADKDFQAGNYNKAIEKYEKLLLEFPTSNLHIDAQIRIADAFGKMDKYEQQMDRLYRLVKENIIPERVPKIYVQIGKFYERAAQFNPGIVTSDSSDYNKALKYYEMATKYPDSDDAVSKSEAAYRRGLVEAKIGQIDDATSRYRLVSSMYPNTNYSILAQIKLKDPANVTELTTTDSAMVVYKQALGLIEVPVDEEAQENIESPVEPEEKSNLDQTIDNMDNENAGGPLLDQESNPESEQIDPNNENPDENLLTPAPEDTTGN
ncbi:MAG: outer membrane protein assembly factor BamD [Calditrichae bacterium]|nr:outer membrane protein assembly factor BamD [Calditrichota bacterium]MCB9058217.1 outer membrane protein assembly factor BamD [Calditrichia bacterium]